MNVMLESDDAHGSLNKRALGSGGIEGTNYLKTRIKRKTYPRVEIITGALCFYPISHCSEWLDIGAGTRVTVPVVLD